MASAAADARWCPVRLRVGGVRGRRGHMRGGAPSVSRTEETVATAANARWCPPPRANAQCVPRPSPGTGEAGGRLSRPARGASPVRLRGGAFAAGAWCVPRPAPWRGRLRPPFAAGAWCVRPPSGSVAGEAAAAFRGVRAVRPPRPAPLRGRPRPPFAANAQCVPHLSPWRGKPRPPPQPTRSASPVSLQGGGGGGRRRGQRAVRPPSGSGAGEAGGRLSRPARGASPVRLRGGGGRGRLSRPACGRRGEGGGKAPLGGGVAKRRPTSGAPRARCLE